MVQVLAFRKYNDANTFYKSESHNNNNSDMAWMHQVNKKNKAAMVNNVGDWATWAVWGVAEQWMNTSALPAG